jgi:hypothetical protein
VYKKRPPTALPLRNLQSGGVARQVWIPKDNINERLLIQLGQRYIWRGKLWHYNLAGSCKVKYAVVCQRCADSEKECFNRHRIGQYLQCFLSTPIDGGTT